MVDTLLLEGSWTINGMVLQLTPWKPNFQDAFERLDTVAMWLQLHHLLMEFWSIELLESLGFQLVKVLKIDNHSLNVLLAKFVRLCVEIDLSKPSIQELWVGPKHDQVMVVILHERLPTLSFCCGRIGHAISSCTFIPCIPIEGRLGGIPSDSGHSTILVNSHLAVARQGGDEEHSLMANEDANYLESEKFTDNDLTFGS